MSNIEFTTESRRRARALLVGGPAHGMLAFDMGEKPLTLTPETGGEPSVYEWAGKHPAAGGITVYVHGDLTDDLVKEALARSAMMPRMEYPEDIDPEDLRVITAIWVKGDSMDPDEPPKKH